MNKKNLIITGSIIFILIVLIVITSLLRNRPVNFKITSNPDKIEVYIGANQKVETPVTIQIKPGNYEIWGLKEGYAPFQQEVKIKKGQENQLNIILEKEAEPPEGAPN